MLGVAWCGILLLGHRWAVVAVLAMLMLGRGGYQTLWASFEGARERSYFGIYTVREPASAGLRELTHGTTLHGLQFTAPADRREPTTYYGRDSGVGAALGMLPQLAGPEARVGVVGLGVGTLACYRQPGQAWDFFEIDPKVVDFSRGADGFTFLRECTPEAPIHLGDARLVLEGFPDRRFDALVIDAFSSDAIPLHIMTTEAFAIYRRTLADDGLLVLHISSRYIDLRPMVAALAKEHGMTAILRSDLTNLGPRISPSMWVVLSPDAGQIARLIAARRDLGWERLPAPATKVWTDDFASILPYIQWQTILGK